MAGEDAASFGLAKRRFDAFLQAVHPFLRQAGLQYFTSAAKVISMIEYRCLFGVDYFWDQRVAVVTRRTTRNEQQILILKKSFYEM